MPAGCWGQWRGTQRYGPMHRLDEDELTRAIIALAANYGRYGYRRITALLRRAGWQVGKDRVQRIWRREGLKVPQKQRLRRRLWLNVKGGEKLGQRGGGKIDHSPVREGVDLLDRAGVAGAEACASVQAARLGRSGRHPSPIVATCGEG